MEIDNMELKQKQKPEERARGDEAPPRDREQDGDQDRARDPKRDRDHEILSLHRGGERERAMRLFVEQYQDRIFGLAWRMFHNYDDALDAAQEVLIQVDRSLPSFRGESSLYTWVYRLSSRTCLNWCRKNRHPQADHGLDEPMRALENLRAKRSQEPEAECERRQRERVLEEALQLLPEQNRMVVILHDLDGLSSPEIGAILEQSTASVKSSLQRGRLALRNILKERMDPGGPEIIEEFLSSATEESVS